MGTKRLQVRAVPKRLAIVVGIDFGATGDEALRGALELAGGPTSEIHLLHALGKEPHARLTPARVAALEARLEKAAGRLRSYATKQGVGADADRRPSSTFGSPIPTRL